MHHIILDNRPRRKTAKDLVLVVGAANSPQRSGEGIKAAEGTKPGEYLGLDKEYHVPPRTGREGYTKAAEPGVHLGLDEGYQVPPRTGQRVHDGCRRQPHRKDTAYNGAKGPPRAPTPYDLAGGEGLLGVFATGPPPHRAKGVKTTRGPRVQEWWTKPKRVCHAPKATPRG